MIDIKETYTSALARLDERIKNIADSIGEIKKSVKELSVHVNEETLKMNIRISDLEKHDIESKAERRTIKMIVGLFSGALTAVLTVLGILAYLGVI